MIFYLTVRQVKLIQTDQLKEHGGQAGIRDEGGLESAVMQPQQAFGDSDLHETVWDKAAAYAYYLAESQAFLEESFWDRCRGARTSMWFCRLAADPIKAQLQDDLAYKKYQLYL